MLKPIITWVEPAALFNRLAEQGVVLMNVGDVKTLPFMCIGETNEEGWNTIYTGWIRVDDNASWLKQQGDIITTISTQFMTYFEEVASETLMDVSTHRTIDDAIAWIETHIASDVNYLGVYELEEFVLVEDGQQILSRPITEEQPMLFLRQISSGAMGQMGSPYRDNLRLVRATGISTWYKEGTLSLALDGLDMVTKRKVRVFINTEEFYGFYHFDVRDYDILTSDVPSGSYALRNDGTVVQLFKTDGITWQTLEGDLYHPNGRYRSSWDNVRNARYEKENQGELDIQTILDLHILRYPTMSKGILHALHRDIPTEE